MIHTTAISTKNFFENSEKEISLSADRKKVLHQIAKEITNEYIHKKEVNLNFICTHNSRRSQLGQVWSFFAATYFKLNIHAYSGGTEVTAFHRNTVKTLQSVGFKFDLKDFSHKNPTYLISFKNCKKSILGFSKTFDDAQNKQPFIAITTCNNADENCPFIPSASHRFHLPFKDPKHSDNSQKQDETYLETNKQIAAEIFFIFSEVSNLIV